MDNQRGLYGKYKVTRTDGKPVGRTIVIEIDKDPHAWIALNALAVVYMTPRPAFSADLAKLAKVRREWDSIPLNNLGDHRPEQSTMTDANPINQTNRANQAPGGIEIPRGEFSTTAYNPNVGRAQITIEHIARIYLYMFAPTEAKTWSELIHAADYTDQQMLDAVKRVRKLYWNQEHCVPDFHPERRLVLALSGLLDSPYDLEEPSEPEEVDNNLITMNLFAEHYFRYFWGKETVTDAEMELAVAEIKYLILWSKNPDRGNPAVFDHPAKLRFIKLFGPLLIPYCL